MIGVCYIIDFTAPVITVSFYKVIYYDVMMNVFILSGPQEKTLKWMRNVIFPPQKETLALHVYYLYNSLVCTLYLFIIRIMFFSK